MRRPHVQPIGSLWPVVCLRPVVLSTLPPGLSRLGKALAPVGQGLLGKGLVPAGFAAIQSGVMGCGGGTSSRQRPGRPGPLYRPTARHRLKPRYPQAFLLRRTCSLGFSVTSTQG